MAALCVEASRIDCSEVNEQHGGGAMVVSGDALELVEERCIAEAVETEAVETEAVETELVDIVERALLPIHACF